MTIIKVCINNPMMTSLCRVQTTRCLGPIVDDRLAANCLIFSDVKEMRDGFSQRLIIPMNSVTISIWPEALDRNRRRSCGGKVDRLGRKENRSGLQMSGMQALHTIPYHGMQAGALCIPSEEKACIRGRSVKSRDWVLERRDEF